LRGGRHVFGSGKTWPHDFLFLVALESLVAFESTEGRSSNDCDEVVDVMSSILIVFGGETSMAGVLT
jgi:hypothetical protein